MRTGLTLIFGLLLAGCASSPVLPPDRSSSNPEWDLGLIRSHAVFLDGEDPEGRKTGTRGFNRAAAYVAGQLSEFGLQPVLSDEFRLQYASKISMIPRAQVSIVGVDTLSFVRGTDYLVEPGSGAGTIRIPIQRIDAEQGVQIPDSLSISVINHTRPDGNFGASYPTIHIREGLLASFPAAEYEVVVTTEKISTVSTAPMHIVGYIPGADPVHRDSLRIILAPIDGFGLDGQRSWTDGSDSSMPASALLEVARRMSHLQNTWGIFKSSFMIAFVSGTRGSCDGGVSLFRNLPWDKSRVASLAVIESEGSRDCDWGGVLKTTDLSAPFIDYSFEVGSPDSARERMGEHFPRPHLLQSEYLDEAVIRAVQMSEMILSDAME